jgi:hypothetical protein
MSPQTDATSLFSVVCGLLLLHLSRTPLTTKKPRKTRNDVFLGGGGAMEEKESFKTSENKYRPHVCICIMKQENDAQLKAIQRTKETS